jgi:CRISPR system Cascade subunit CasE
VKFSPLFLLAAIGSRVSMAEAPSTAFGQSERLTMAALQSIQVDIDIPAAARAVALSHAARHHNDLLLKTVLTTAFAGPAIRPWMVHRQDGPTATLLGYSNFSAGDLRQRLALSLPALGGAVRGIHGHAMPEFQAGMRLRFSVRLCPTVHVTSGKEGTARAGHRHGERDAFLVAVDRGAEGPTRDGVYSAYLAERLAGARIETCRLMQMRLAPMLRPHRGSGAPASGYATRTMPDVALEGLLTVVDPVPFTSMLGAGIGRPRAYGRGYVRLEPERLAVVA